jgi:type I restriction enzyme, S subunit
MPEIVLGECLDLLIDNRGKNPQFTSSGIPVISAMLVQAGRLRLDGARYVSTETYQQWMPTPTRKNDVLLTSEAPLGRVALIPDDRPLVLAQRIFGLRGKAGIIDSRFLFYAFQTEAAQNELRGRATGTTVTGIRQSELVKVKMRVPSYRGQQAIAAILGALDDKIAVNDRIVTLSVDLADAFYRMHS